MWLTVRSNKRLLMELSSTTRKRRGGRPNRYSSLSSCSLGIMLLGACSLGITLVGASSLGIILLVGVLVRRITFLTRGPKLVVEIDAEARSKVTWKEKQVPL
jgi:hypothetical protein